MKKEHYPLTVRKFKDRTEYGYFNDRKQFVLHNLKGPAVVYKDGEKLYYKRGKFHRKGNKPAVIAPDGVRLFYKNGLLHNEEGPASIFPGEETKYYINGVELTQEQFKARKNKKKRLRLYLVSQIEKATAYSYTSMIVCAETKDQARQVHPFGPIGWNHSIWGKGWCSSPDLATVDFIGFASKKMKKGQIVHRSVSA